MLSEQIKYFRKKNGYTQDELASILRKKYGLRTDRAMVSKWETGFQTPQMHTITCLADLFNISIDTLNDGETKLKSPIITDDNVSFPVIGELAAGYEHIAMEDWSGETIEIPESYLKGRKREDYLVLSVKGDSMYPHYQDGDKVLILKQDCINESGDIAAVIYDGEYATLKKVEYKKDAVRLVPLNPEYKPREISGADLEQFKIIGIPRLLVRDIED